MKKVVVSSFAALLVFTLVIIYASSSKKVVQNISPNIILDVRKTFPQTESKPKSVVSQFEPSRPPAENPVRNSESLRNTDAPSSRTVSELYKSDGSFVRTPLSDQPPSSSAINPGCAAKDLPKYKAVDTGRVYHHPPIAHFVKLSNSGGVQLSFREYTSVLAVYKFLQPKRIMFHIYTSISGKYWDKVNALKDVEIVANKVPPVTLIGGKRARWIQHHADFVKLNMVYKHGGVALDFDVIIINGTRLKREQSLSECVLAEEHEFINGGFYSCVANATFMADWLKSYHTDYRPDKWLHNISYHPLNLLTEKSRKKCYNVHLDDTLCLFPSWSMNRDWLKPNGVKWRTKTAAHYFVKTGIPHDGESLLTQKFPLAELIQYVHHA